MRVSTGCSIFRRVAASCATTTKFINSYKNLYFIGSKALGWTKKMSEGILAIIFARIYCSRRSSCDISEITDVTQ